MGEMASKLPANSEKNADWEAGYKVEDFKAMQKDGGRTQQYIGHQR